MCRYEIAMIGLVVGSLLIDDQFASPIRLPLLMKIGDERDPTLGGPSALDKPALISIVMGQKTIPCRIRIVTKPQMTSDDVREGFDVVLNEGKL